MKKILKILVPILILAVVGVGGFFGYRYYRSIKGDSNTIVYNEDGSYSEDEILNDVVINASSIELRNKTIQGTLTVKSNGTHDVLLRNVAIGGDIVVEDAEQEYTLILSNVSCRNIKINSDVPVNVKVLDSTVVSQVTTATSLTITENLDKRSEGVKNVVLMSNKTVTTDKEGNEIVEGGEEINVSLYDTNLDSIMVSSPTTIYLNRGSAIDNLSVNEPTNIINEGTIDLLTANADTVYLNEPNGIVVKDGVIVRSQNEVVEGNNAPVTSETEVTTTTTTTTTEPEETTTTKKTTTSKVTTTTTKVVNYPVISCEDKAIIVGDKFNPLTGVTCNDVEDGKIAVKSTHIDSNNVNTSIPGIYSVVYSVTDKDGNKSTKTRKIVVEEDPNKLSAPLNLAFDYDKEGNLILSWDPVSDAYDYSIYVNNRNVIKSTSNTTANITSYIDINKANVIGVAAGPSPTSDLKESVVNTIEYKYDPGMILLPTSTKISTATEGFFEFDPLYVNERAINRVTVTVEKYVGREYIPVSGVKVTKNRTTDDDGQAYITNYARGEGELAFTFITSGAYRVTLELNAGNDDEIKLEHIIDVYNFDGTLNSDGKDIEISDFYANYSSTRRWNLYLKFIPSMDINLSKTYNDLSVTFYYSVGENEETELCTLDLYDLDMQKKTLYSGVEQTIKVAYNEEVQGVEDFWEFLNSDTYNDEPIKIRAELNIKVGLSSTSTTEYSLETTTIRFN